MLYHIEFKSKIDGRWIGARVGHSMTKSEAEEMILQRQVRYPEAEYRIAHGAYLA